MKIRLYKFCFGYVRMDSIEGTMWKNNYERYEVEKLPYFTGEGEDE